MPKKIRIPGTNLEAEVVPEEVCVRAEFFVATSDSAWGLLAGIEVEHASALYKQGKD